MFWQYPHLISDYLYFERNATDYLWNGYAYNLFTGRCYYNGRIRSWYLNAKTDFGYSYLNSLYIFSSNGKYGNTLSMTVRQKSEQLLGVINFDFMPLGEESYVETNLFSTLRSTALQFDYFLLSPALLNKSYSRTEDFIFGEAKWDLVKISELLVDLIYKNDTPGFEIKKLSIQNIQKETIYYAEFTGGGQQRYMFFSPWYLNMRARDGRMKRVVGDIFVLISTKSFFNKKRESIQKRIENYAFFIGILVILFIVSFGFMLTNWISNKYSGIIVKQIWDASKSILELNYSLLKQRLGSEEKLKNIISKREVKDKVENTDNELDTMLAIFGQFVRMFRIHFIDITNIEDKQLLNQILMEYYMAK